MNYEEPIPGVPIYTRSSATPSILTWASKLEHWRPLYLEKVGNASLVALCDGSAFYTVHSAMRILKNLARVYQISLVDQRRHYIDSLGLSQSVPLVVAARNTSFIAVKVRTPEYKYEGATAYVAASEVASIWPRENSGAVLKMKSGRELVSAQSIRHVYAQRDRAELFWQYLEQLGVLPKVSSAHCPLRTR